MRKLASIILLTLLAFNIIGYRAWFYFAERNLDAATEARLDRDDYDAQNLVSIVVPLHNPYQLEQRNFVRVNGEISFEGKTYKYVKRRISDGYMTLLCIPDFGKMLLKKGQSEYGAASIELPANKSNSSIPNLFKAFAGSDYLDHAPDYTLFFCNGSSPDHQACQVNFLPDPLMASPGKPPQA